MIGFRDLQVYSEVITNTKEKVSARKLQRKVETMLGYQTDKMAFDGDLSKNIYQSKSEKHKGLL